MRRRRRGIGRGVVFDVAAGAEVVVEDGAVIGAGTRFHVRAGVVRIAAGAVLGERCVVLAHAGVEVGAHAILGDDVVLVDFQHRFDDAERPVREQPLDAAPITIGERAHIGHRAVIERGVSIAAGARVPAQTVVRYPGWVPAPEA